MSSIRLEKVAGLLQRDLGVIFQQESRNLFGGAMISVTQVRVSPDLGLAKVYLSMLINGDKEKMLKHVRSSKNAIKRLLGKKIGKQVRRIPDLEFFVDDSLDYYERIDELLKK